MMNSGRVPWLQVLVTLLLATTFATGANATHAKCAAKKMKLAGKYVLCRVKAEAKAGLKGTPPDFTKCDAKFAKKLERINNSSLECLAAVDDKGLADIAIADAGLIAGTVSLAARFQNNGDGTTTDINTGLTWENKSYLDSSIHDIAVHYDFDDAVSVHVASLNGSSFAGRDDWRVPSILEMLSLINFDTDENPQGFPEFDVGCVTGCDISTCSCAFSEIWGGETFWTNQTDPNTSLRAIGVSSSGSVLELTEFKIFDHAVIAVRGGRRGN